MVKSSSKFKKLLSFSSKKPTFTDDTAQISPPVVNRGEALPLSGDLARGFPYAPITSRNTEPLPSIPSTEWTESHSMSLRSRLEKVLNMGRGAVEREDIKCERRTGDGNDEFKKVIPEDGLSGEEEDGGRQPIHSRSPTEMTSLSPFSPSAKSRSRSMPLDVPIPSSSDTRSIDSFSLSVPPSPTLSTQSSIHFATTMALRDNKPGDGLSPLGLLNVEQLARKHSRKPSWASLGEDHNGGNQFGPGTARRRSSILLSPSPTLSRESSVQFMKGVAVRKKTSAEAFSRRNSLGWMSASPARSVQSSVHFSPSVERHSNSALEDDLMSQDAAEGSNSRARSRAPSKSRSERSYPQHPKSALPWSVHRLQLPPPVGLGIASVNFPSPSPFPRYHYAVPATATQSGEFFLFGGLVDDKPRKDLYRFSARDRSATLLQTAGDIPSRRIGHASALVSNMLFVWGGHIYKNNTGRKNVEGHDNGLYKLNLGSREWIRVDMQGQCPVGRYRHTITPVGSKLFLFGGQVDARYLNDLWSFDSDSLRSTPSWQFHEPPLGSEMPPARVGHVSVSYGDKLFIFGGISAASCYNDVWSFDTFIQKWSRLECTGSPPSPREGHAAALVGDVIYVFGGRRADGRHLSGLFALVITSQRWYSFDEIGPEPDGRSGHTMVSVGPKIFVLGGASTLSKTEDHESIHILDTTYLRYAESSRPPTPTSLFNVGSIGAPSFEVVAMRLRRGGQFQTDAELPEPDQGNAETGSRSSSDQSELPWFDPDNAETNIVGFLEKNSYTENDYAGPSFSSGSKGAQNGVGSLLKIGPSPPKETSPGLVPSPVTISPTEGRKIVLTSSSEEFETDSDSDSWSSEEISADNDITLEETLEVQRQRSSLAKAPKRSPVDTRVTNGGTGVELHTNLPKIYKNLVSLLSRKVSELNLSSQSARYSNMLRAHVENMQVDSTVSGLVQSFQYRMRLMALSSALGCHDDQEFRNALDEDEADIVQMLEAVLRCDADRKAVLQLRGDDAERFLTLTHNAIDKQAFPFNDDGQRSRHSAHRLLVKLSENCGILPSILSIAGIENCSKEPVAGGGFADIFRASYRGEDVALKRLRDFQVHQQREMIHRRFCREAILWQDLKHPNVLPFYGIDLQTFLPRLSMVSPWMQHGTILKHITDIGGPLPANVDRYLFEIAQGLHYLHSRNIIHGDLRGTNIFIDDQWHVRLADFGLAGFADATLVTHTSNNAGSIRWMAPELHNPEIFDLKELRRTAASDVYALACVALEIYTGNYPFADILRDGTVILKVMQGERPVRPSSATGRPISDELWCIIELCWQQVPSDRPNMLHVLESLKIHQSGCGHPHSISV